MKGKKIIIFVFVSIIIILTLIEIETLQFSVRSSLLSIVRKAEIKIAENIKIAETRHVVKGKNYFDEKGVLHIGNMTDNGAIKKAMGPKEETYTIPEGYHNGQGTVTESWKNREIVLFENGQFKNCTFANNILTYNNTQLLYFYNTKVEGNVIKSNKVGDGIYTLNILSGYIYFVVGGEFYCQTGIGTGTLPNMLLTGEKRTSFCNLPVNNDNYKICISLLGVYKYIGLLDQQKPMVFKKIVLIMQSIPEVIM